MLQMFFAYVAGQKWEIGLPPTDVIFQVHLFLCWNSVWSQAEQKLDIKVAICEGRHPLSLPLRHLLVPTVSDREHPLVVDEHTATEVVTVVKGGHVRAGVGDALPPADDLAIPAGNRNCTHTQNKQQEKKVTRCPLGRRPKCDRVSICLYGSHIFTSSSKHRQQQSQQSHGVRWAIRRHLDTPRLGFICLRYAPVISQLFFSLWMFFLFCSCWPHLCHSTLFPLGTHLEPRSNLLSGFGFFSCLPAPALHVPHLLFCRLYHRFPNAIQGLCTFNAW